jgi:hypothetical protein
MSGTLRVNDSVQWRGSFGMDAPKTVVVVGMEVTKHPREKHGDAVQEVEWSQVQDNKVVFTLSSGNWAYGEQISPL